MTLPGHEPPTSHTLTPAYPVETVTGPPPARRRRFPIWLVVGLVVLALAGAGAGWAMTRGAGEDPGVAACKQSAENARTNHTPDAAERQAQATMLKQSSHDDLRQIGAELDALIKVWNDPSSIQRVVDLGMRFVAACAAQDVVIPAQR